MPKYPDAAITWPTDSFDARLRSDWMWNMVLKTAVISVYSCFYVLINIIVFFQDMHERQ